MLSNIQKIYFRYYYNRYRKNKHEILSKNKKLYIYYHSYSEFINNFMGSLNRKQRREALSIYLNKY